jgi:hypothetical protein
MMQAVANKLLDDLILARLLVVGKRPIGPGKLQKDVTRLLPTQLSAEQWQTSLTELEQAGLLRRSPFALTEAGRARALAFLELDALPPRTNWGTIQGRYLVPRALGLSSGDRKGRDRLKVANNLRAAALRKSYDLRVKENASLRQTVEAAACQMICQQLGLEPLFDLESLQLAVFNRLLNPTVPLTSKTLGEQLPGYALGASRSGLQGLRDAILSRWLDSSAETQPPVTPSNLITPPAPAARLVEPPREERRELHLDPTTFAATVQAAARSCPTGHWGDNKVFINHVWRQLQQEPNFPRLDLAAFKERLIEANQRGLLQLEQADLVEPMNPEDVRESETTFLTATYHFIVVERNRP